MAIWRTATSKSIPELESDVRNLGYSDDIKVRSTRPQSSASNFEVLSKLVFDRGVNQVIRPAKVRVYRYEGNEELDK